MKSTVTDIAERTIFTWLEVFIGLLLVGWVDATSAADYLDLGTSAALASVPAGLAVIKGALATRVGEQGTAAVPLKRSA